MSTRTPLDHAHAQMEADADSDTARRSYYAFVVAAELFVPTHDDSDRIRPHIIETDGAQFALAFDTEDRLAAFFGAAQTRVALRGSDLVAALAADSLGLGINLGVADSAYQLPPDAVQWLAEFSITPRIAGPAQATYLSPDYMPEHFAGLDRLFASFSGLAGSAHCVTARDGNTTFPLIILAGTDEAHQPGIAAAVAEFFTIAVGIDTASVAFRDPDDALLQVAVSFQIPQPAHRHPSAPGTDPDRPPILR